jgi:ornithine carbamoyltransferase/carbamoyltransferase
MTAWSTVKARTADVVPGLTSLRHCTADEVAQLTARAVQLFRNGPDAAPLLGLSIGIWFQMTSTRTRTAFTVAAHRLGGAPIAFGADEMQTATGETDEDTARVLGSMLDGLVVRSRGSSHDLERLQGHAGVPVVNAMASDEHPTQGLCDLATLVLHLGPLTGRRVLYVGEGNNSASALVRGAALVPGLHLRLVVPEGYGLDPDLVRTADSAALADGGSVTQDHDIDDLCGDVDAVYTTRWQTTGTQKSDPEWKHRFEPYRVDARLMARMPGAIFMHDLPAHRGDEVTGDVLDGPRSVAWDQARMKLYSAMAVLEVTFARH